MSVIPYPHKPIRIFLSHAKGGSSNTTIESMGSGLARRLGQTIEFVDASGGRAGSNAPVVVAAAPPDGHNLLMATIGNIALLPSIYPGYGIDPVRDLVPITKICDTPNVLIARPSLDISSIAELIALAKSKPGELRCSGVNPAAIHQVELNNLVRETGIVIKDISGAHMGANPSLEAFDDGKIDLLIMTSPRAVMRILAGRASGVAAIGDKRISALPELPTALEQGLSSLSTGSWSGLFAPRGTPSETIATLFAAVKSTAESQEVRDQAAKEGMIVSTSVSPAEFKDFIISETARLAVEAKEFGMVGI